MSECLAGDVCHGETAADSTADRKKKKKIYKFLHFEIHSETKFFFSYLEISIRTKLLVSKVTLCLRRPGGWGKIDGESPLVKPCT